MSDKADDKKAVEQPSAQPMRRNLRPETPDGPRVSTITVEPDNIDSVNAAMRILKQMRADIDAAARAKAEK